jgi:WD40 repeat protein
MLECNQPDAVLWFMWIVNLHKVFAVQVICAGSLDTFQVYVWSVRTGRLLDVLAGHEGPVAGLAFSPTQSLLASASWDKTVRTWDVFRYSPSAIP